MLRSFLTYCTILSSASDLLPFVKGYTFGVLTAAGRSPGDIDMIRAAFTLLVIFAADGLAADVDGRAAAAAGILEAVALPFPKALTARILTDPRMLTSHFNIASAAVHRFIVHTILCRTN